MRTLDPSILTAMNRGVTETPFYLICTIDTGTERVRITNAAETVTFGGNDYAPYPFRLDDRSEAGDGELPTARLTFANIPRNTEAGQYLSDWIDKNALVKDLRVTLSVVFGNNTVRSDTYEVGTPEVTRSFISLPLVKEGLFSVLVPRQTATIRCMNAYKGADCEYSGTSTSCDKGLWTTNGCRAHDNVSNFKGFVTLTRR